MPSTSPPPDKTNVPAPPPHRVGPGRAHSPSWSGWSASCSTSASQPTSDANVSRLRATAFTSSTVMNCATAPIASCASLCVWRGGGGKGGDGKQTVGAGQVSQGVTSTEVQNRQKVGAAPAAPLDHAHTPSCCSTSSALLRQSHFSPCTTLLSSPTQLPPPPPPPHTHTAVHQLSSPSPPNPAPPQQTHTHTQTIYLWLMMVCPRARLSITKSRLLMDGTD